MSKMGAPRKEIDYDQLEKLCRIQCTEEEIAGFFDVSIETLNTRVKEKYGCTFLEYNKRCSQFGKCSLRRELFKKAQGGNVPILIWLSKQYLGMRDKHEHEYDDDNFTPVKITFEQKDCRVECD